MINAQYISFQRKMGLAFIKGLLLFETGHVTTRDFDLLEEAHKHNQLLKLSCVELHYWADKKDATLMDIVK
jgi:hypothetical protein